MERFTILLGFRKNEGEMLDGLYKLVTGQIWEKIKSRNYWCDTRGMAIRYWHRFQKCH